MISGQTAGLWLLADCNNFYASCEQLFRPDLRNRPVVVLSNNDGCVIARSAEAKALNIAMGEAEFRIHGFLKEHGVAVFSSNFALYGDLSARVIQTLETLCQDVRQYSIDEAFCRLTGAEAANAAELASEARLRVERWTGIPVSIGISSTKTLAKLANHAAKKSGRGLWQILPGEEDCTRLLRESPVEEVWGVGRRVAARLSAAGIRTAFDLARADDAWIRRRFSVTLWNTALELRGVSAVPDGDPGSIRQTLVVSRSFGHRITRKDLLMEAISAFTERALERLRGERLVARGFSVHVQTSLFEKDGVYANSVTVNLPFPSADTALFLKKARGALNAIWKPGYRYARGGVMLFSVEREDRRELSLLAPQEDGKKQARLMKAMDDINARYGHRTVTFASAGLPSDLSPARTTSWKAPACPCRCRSSSGQTPGRPAEAGADSPERARRRTKWAASSPSCSKPRRRPGAVSSERPGSSTARPGSCFTRARHRRPAATASRPWGPSTARLTKRSIWICPSTATCRIISAAAETSPSATFWPTRSAITCRTSSALRTG